MYVGIIKYTPHWMERLIYISSSIHVTLSLLHYEEVQPPPPPDSNAARWYIVQSSFLLIILCLSATEELPVILISSIVNYSRCGVDTKIEF